MKKLSAWNLIVKKYKGIGKKGSPQLAKMKAELAQAKSKKK
jgi:hypothetical protein